MYNLSKIEFGRYEIHTWFTSPYPPDYTQLDKIYICEYCLKCFRTTPTLQRHTEACPLPHPPGVEIYRKDQVSVFEVDGEMHKVT